MVWNAEQPLARVRRPHATARRRTYTDNRSIFAAGAALFSDGYANAVISPVNTVLAILYPKEMDAEKTNNRTLLSAMGFAGSEYLSIVPCLPLTRAAGLASASARYEI